jgi:hypothetical protein
MHRSRRALALLLLAAFASGCASTPTSEALAPDAVKVRVGQIDPDALESAVRSAPRSLAARTEHLVDALWQAGCLGSAVETPLPRISGHPDVVCSLPGRTTRRIVVVSHLDADAKDAASPHWSGVALMPFLYRALTVAPREHTFVFAAFGKSPQRSARDYLTRLGSPHADDVRAIVDLQDVDPRSVWFSSSDAGLRRDFVAASLAVGRPLDTLRSFLPAAGESRAGVATLTVAAAPPVRPGQKLPSVDAAPKSEATSLPATARFTAVFLAYADETLRLRAEALDAPPAPEPARESR